MSWNTVEQLYARINDIVWLGNTGGDYLYALGVFLLAWIVLRFFQYVLLKRLASFAEKTSTDIDDLLIRIVKSFRPPFYFLLALFIGAQSLALSDTVNDAFALVLLIVVVYYALSASGTIIDYLVRKYSDGDQHARSAYRNVGTLLKFILWVIGVLLVLSNLGIEITSLIAGLGVGGVAIAFALQKILGDLFSSFAIHFDKPFVVGDFIVVGEHMGVVQKIGIKTTRIKALQGEEIVIANQELTDARVQNFKKLEERRVVTTLGLTYDTSNKKVEYALEKIRSVLESLDSVRFDRVHFKSFGDSALLLEVVYYIESKEYIDFMDTQQAFNFALKEDFEKQGIEFAFPTQTIHVASTAK